MEDQQTSTDVNANALATDLDGTLIPLSNHQDNRDALKTLAESLARHEVPLIYVTGRHRESVVDAINEYGLPIPHWLICDVGTSILRPHPDSKFQLLESFHQHLESLITGSPIDQLKQQLQAVAGLRLQEPEKQGVFKLSYYTGAQQIDDRVAEIQRILSQHRAPYGIIASVDPFNGDGLIDLLPNGVSKSYALNWLAAHLKVPTRSIVFAGDSGNDYAALTAGFRSIVVGNADRQLAERVVQAHRVAGWRNRLHLATEPATSGVLEGCRAFGLF